MVFDAYGETAFGVGRGSVGGSLLDHARAGHRFAGRGVQHGARYSELGIDAAVRKQGR